MLTKAPEILRNLTPKADDQRLILTSLSIKVSNMIKLWDYSGLALQATSDLRRTRAARYWYIYTYRSHG